MITLRKISFAALIALAMAPAAYAVDGYQDRAQDKEGRPIMDARGNCVLTKWEVNQDPCNPEAPRLVLSKAERTVYFDFNKSTIKASEKPKLDSLIRAIRNSKQVKDVDIVGYTDSIGTDSYNNRLSTKRAQAVKAYLQRYGAIKTRNIDLRGLGESGQVSNCDPNLSRAEAIACKAEDRRVEIELNYMK